MATDEWFRNKKWSNEEEKFFFEKLKRCKSNLHKAQYTRIKAYHLFETGKKDSVIAAIKLLEKIIKEWPVRIQLAQCYSQLAKAYEFLGDTEHSLEFFEKCYNFEKNFKTIKTGIALNYAEFIVKNNLINLWGKALTMLEDDRKEDNYLFPVQHFLYHGLLAILLTGKNNNLSKNEAKIALQYANKKTSGLRYHKNLGLVARTHWLIKKLDTMY